jgi:hypothetical protein
MRPTVTIPDLSEKGRNAAGETISLDRRLFMQVLAWTGSYDHGELAAALADSPVQGALLLDFNDPQGVALVAAHESPAFFTGELRTFLNQSLFADLTPRPGFTMLGRSYSIGYEADLEHVLFKRPHRARHQPGHPVAGVVSAAPQGQLRKAAARRAKGHPLRARQPGRLVQRGRFRATTSAWTAAGWTPTTTTS